MLTDHISKIKLKLNVFDRSKMRAITILLNVVFIRVKIHKANFYLNCKILTLK